MRNTVFATTAAVALGVLSTSASAQIKVGVTLSLTGPAASLGIPMRNAISLAPKTIGGKTVEYVVLDDATDPTAARRNIERFVTDEKVDVIIGSSTTPNSLAMIEVAGRSKTPMISMGAGKAIIFPMDDNRRWAFKMPYNDATTAAATVRNMVSHGVKSVATISVNDAYGEGWVREFRPLAEKAGINVVASELYAAKDTSVTGQILKIMSAKPDAVLVTGAGTVAALPQIALAERGFKGKMYVTTGNVSADYLRIGGKAVEGTLIAGAPMSVAMQVPDNHPAKAAAVSFAQKYDAAFGAGTASSFAGYVQDAILVLEAAIPVALKAGAPGSEAFRTALRDAIENSKGVQTTAGPVTMSPEDHSGFSTDAPIMIEVKNGKFEAAGR